MSTKVRPSDVVVWRERTPGVWELTQLGTSTFVDKTDTSNTRAEWFARLVYLGDDPLGHLDPDDDRWQLRTQGASTGGLRYRDWTTYAEAQRVALAWLDRRFSVKETS